MSFPGQHNFTTVLQCHPLRTNYETTTVFTDDHAPIEWIVNDMVIRFILSGNTQYLQ